MKRRDFIRKIEQAGWSFKEEGGEHTKYVRSTYSFAVPRHREISAGVVRSWEKLNRKIDDEEGEP